MPPRRPYEHPRSPRDHGAHPPADHVDPVGPPARHVPRLARPDDRVDGHADHRRQAQRPDRTGLGHDRLPGDEHGQHPALREAVGPLRPQAVLPVRDRRVPRRLGAVRPGPLDLRAGRVPRDPGPGRRRSALAGLHDHRRPGGSARAREVPGLLHHGLRHLERPRSGGRRLLRRPAAAARRRRLAVDLLRQRPHRGRRVRRRLA